MNTFKVTLKGHLDFVIPKTYDMVTDAIQRETTLKHWLRKWKLDLIEKSNPNWDDLYETL